MKGWTETTAAVEKAMAEFPTEFGLRAFPGHVFRISKSHSYFNDSDVLMLYTERKVDGQWQSFAKGSVNELLMQIVIL